MSKRTSVLVTMFYIVVWVSFGICIPIQYYIRTKMLLISATYSIYRYIYFTYVAFITICNKIGLYVCIIIIIILIIRMSIIFFSWHNRQVPVIWVGDDYFQIITKAGEPKLVLYGFGQLQWPMTHPVLITRHRCEFSRSHHIITCCWTYRCHLLRNKRRV